MGSTPTASTNSDSSGEVGDSMYVLMDDSHIFYYRIIPSAKERIEKAQRDAEEKRGRSLDQAKRRKLRRSEPVKL